MANGKGIGCGTAIIIIFLLMVFFGLSDKKPPTDNQTSSPPSSTSPLKPASNLPPPEKAYLEAACGLLINNHEASLEVMKNINQLDSGLSTLGDIKNSLEIAKDVHAVNWLKYKETPVPPKFRAVDKEIRKASRLRYAGLKEMLVYWQDHNKAHSRSGMNTFSRALPLEGSALKKLNKIMDDLSLRR